jgi:cytochrome bd-type quinol oxidase subunit 1
MYDMLLLIIIGIQFDWIASLAGWIMKLFGLQDVFYYIILKEKLPQNWTWMKWTPLGFFKGNLSKNEIVIQSVIGIFIAIVLLILR